MARVSHQPPAPENRPKFRLTSPTQRQQIERATRPKEIQIHCAYVAWCRRMQTALPALERGFHPANGELRDAKVGAKLKRMGVRSGVLDWVLPVACGGYGGLFIEFKRPLEGPNDEQLHEIEQLRAEGYCVAVFDDWERAAKYTVEYVAGRIVRPRQES